jgi:hypothetical protein
MPITPDIPAAEAAIVEMTNAFRKDHKLSALTLNPQLVAAARAYAEMLAERTDLPHTLDGSTPASRATQAGYAYCQIAENLARAYDSRGFSAREYARRAIKGWRASPGHRRNLLLPHLTDIGVAVARASSEDPTYIAVELFGRPLALEYEFKVSNDATRTVAYEFAGKRYELERQQYMRHKACMPGTITFTTDGKSRVRARYEARNGDVYTLRPDANGGVKVEVAARADGEEAGAGRRATNP